jgi:D-alanine-D-alanine ligase
MRIIIIYNKDLDNVISKFGGQNQELYEEQAIKRIETIFRSHNYEVSIVDGNLDMFEKLRELSAEKDRIPFVFNMAYGIQGESRYAHIPSILEMLGLPYFGSGPLGHSLALDKITTKRLMLNHDIPTSSFWVFNSQSDLDQEIGFPVILKPSMDAGSLGLKVANDNDDLMKAVTSLLKKHSPVFAERFIRGREFALGLLGNGKNIECLPLIEIVLDDPKATFDSEQKKNRPRVKPADIPHKIVEELEQKAKELFSILRLRDYARIDIRMDEDEKFWFLEINSMAGLRTTGLFMAAAEIAGYKYDEMILKLFDVALRKYFVKRQKLKLRYESKYNKGGKQF